MVEAGRRSGERMWRLPLAEEYREHLRSDVADRHSSPLGGPGAVVAGLFLHEFLGDAAPHWAHLDIAGPAWADETELERNRGATGWGVRTLLRWLEGLAVSA